MRIWMYCTVSVNNLKTGIGKKPLYPLSSEHTINSQLDLIAAILASYTSELYLWKSVYVISRVWLFKYILDHCSDKYFPFPCECCFFPVIPLWYQNNLSGTQTWYFKQEPQLRSLYHVQFRIPVMSVWRLDSNGNATIIYCTFYTTEVGWWWVSGESASWGILFRFKSL